MIIKFEEFLRENVIAPSYNAGMTNFFTGKYGDPHEWIINELDPKESKCPICKTKRYKNFKLGHPFYKYFSLDGEEDGNPICFPREENPAIKAPRTGDEIDLKPYPKNFGMWNTFKANNKPGDKLPKEIKDYNSSVVQNKYDKERLISDQYNKYPYPPRVFKNKMEHINIEEEKLKKIKSILLDDYKDTPWIDKIT